MSEQTNLKTNAPEEEQQRQRGLWAAGIFIAVGAAFMVLSFYAVIVAQQGRFDLEDTILMPTTVILTIGSLLGYFLMRQERYKTGSELLFVAMMLTPVMGTLVLSNILIVAVAFIAIFAPLMVRWVLLKASRPRALAALALVALALIGIEFWNPGFRGVSDVAIHITPIVVALAAVALLSSVVRPLWTKGNIQTKIVLWAGTGFLISSALIIAYAAFTLRSQVSRSAEETAQKIAREQAAEIQTILERTLGTAETFTQALLVVKTEGVQLSRAQVNAMLRQVLKENPQFVGVDVLWEPNAFDGMDAAFANTEGSDANGRFLPYWTRGANGEIQVELLQDYDVSEWYQCPKTTKVTCLIDPYLYPVQGQDVWMTSVVAPFVFNDTFYGITGIDTPVTFLQEIADSVEIFGGSGAMAILSNNGTLLGVTGQPELIGQPVTALHDHFSAEDYSIIKDGQEKLRYDDEGMLEAYAPIRVGETVSPWSVNVLVPREIILADAARQMWNMIGIGGGLFVLSLVALFYAARQIAQPIRKITEVAQQVTAGNFDVTANVKSTDETGTLATAFNQMTSQLRDFISTLESRVAERTRNLELAAEVGRAVSQVRSLEVMLKEAAELIRAQFDLYYVQVYLVNPAQTHLTLQAGTGEVGAALLERKHQLPIDTGSINGRAAIEKKPQVISDTAASAVFKPNPLLPSTRSEMAVPLMVGGRVVGVLDMQGDQAGSLNQDVLPAFEALAGQVAIAIQNASLLAEAEQARAEVEAQARRLVRAGWQDYLDALHKPEQTGFIYEQGQVLPLEDETASPQPDALAVPISFTGEQLGSLVVEVEQERQTPQAVELVNIVARQVAQQIENLRLLETAERYRFEAEQAARRLTREGWEEYFNAKAGQSLGYLYDLKEVKAIESETTLAAETGLTVPIKARDETIGKLAVLDLDTADPATLELVHAVSERLSEHIESLRLLEETQRGQVELNKRARHLAAVSQISTVSSRELDVRKMLATVVQMAQREFGLYHAHVFTYNEHANHLEIVACGWKEGDAREGTHETTVIPLDQEQSLVARAARSRLPVVINNARGEPGWLPNPLLPDTRSELAVPLVIGDEVLGVLDVQSDRLNAFSEEDINIQSTLAAQVATALQNARSFARAQRQAEREAMLNAISQKIQSATSVEAVLQIAARELGHALGAPRAIAQLSMKDKN